MTTDTEAPDELEVPHLKARLWHELAELHHERLEAQSLATGGWRGAHAPPASTVPRRHHAAAVALVVGLVTAQLVGTSSDTPLMGRIVAATDEAAASSVIHSVDEQTRPGDAGPSSVLEIWTDDSSEASRILHRGGQGDPTVDVGPLIGPTIESPAHSGQRVVDYCTRQYVDHVDTQGASTDIMGDGLRGLREAVAAGRLIEVGT